MDPVKEGGVHVKIKIFSKHEKASEVKNSCGGTPPNSLHMASCRAPKKSFPGYIYNFSVGRISHADLFEVQVLGMVVLTVVVFKFFFVFKYIFFC